MKTTTLILILFLTGLDLWAQNIAAVRQMPRRVNTAANTTSPPPNAELPRTRRDDRHDAAR